MSARPPDPDESDASRAGWSEVDAAAAAASVEGPHAEATARYRIGGTLGRGGMGHVRVAFDRILRREVALKEVRREVSGDVAERLTREARITAHLEHPGIVPIYDAGRSEDGRLFYTMRLVRGRSLEAVLGESTGEGAWRGLLRTFLAVCETVAYAHANGVVHRDLKPANVMVGPFGEVQVVDWGLARGLDDDDDVERPWSGDPALTVVGSVVGTPGYMSPEQARGEPATPRSDVWSLGAMLHEVLGGQPPYGRGESAVALARAGAPVVLTASAPADLLAVVARAVAPDAADRYADAAELAQEVSAWLDGRRVEAYPYSPLELLAQLARAWRTPLVVVGVVALLLLVGAVFAFERIRNERDRAEIALHEASVALAAQHAEQARQAAQRGDRPEAERLAARSLEVAESPEARGVLARLGAIPPPLRGAPIALPACRARVFDAAARALLCLERDATSLWEVGADQPRWRVPVVATDAAHVAPLERVVLVADRQLRVLDAADGRVVHAPDETLPNDVGMLASAVDRHVAFLTVRLVVLDVATGEVVVRDPCVGGDPARFAAVDPRGERIAVMCGADEVRVGAVTDPSPPSWRLGFRDGLSGPNAVTFLPERLVVGLGDGRLVQRDLLTGAPVGPEGAAGSAIRGLSTEDGSVVAVTRERGGPGVYDPRTGHWAAHLPVGRVVAVQGRDVFTAGEALFRWTAPTGRGISEARVEAGVTAAIPSPDGARIGVTGAGGTVALVDVSDGTTLTAEPRISWVVKHGAFTPDGGTFLLAVSGSPGLQAMDVASGHQTPILGSTTCRRVTVLGDTPVVLPYGVGPEVWDPGLRAMEVVGDRSFHDLDADGSRAVLLDEAGGVWWMGEADGLVPRRAFTVSDAVAVALAGPEVVVASARRVAIYDGSGVEIRSWAHEGEHVIDVDVSHDLRWVATADHDGGVRVFDRASGRLVSVYGAHDQRASSVAFEPGGGLVSAGWDGRVIRHGLAVLDESAASIRRTVDAAWGP